MTLFARTGVLTFGGILLALPAWADFTAQEYWDYTVASASAEGTEISVNSVTRTEQGLIIEGLTLEGADGDGTFVITLDGYTLNNHPSGAVEMLLPAQQTMTMVVDSEDDTPITLEFTLSQTGFSALISGELDALDTEALSDSILLELTSVDAGDMEIDATAQVSITQMSLISENLSIDLDQPFAYELDASSLEIAYDVNLPSVGVITASRTTMDDVSGVLRATIEDEPLASDILFELTSAATRLETRQAAPDTGEIAYDITTGQVAYNAVLQEGALAVGSAVADLKLAADVQRLPIGPIDFAAQTAAVEIGIPLRPDPAEQNAAMSIDLQGLRVSENIWRMGDPTAAIPRDPVALTLELSGHLLVSEPTAPELPSVDSLPLDFVPTNAKIDTLFAAFGGATLSGIGAFVFDPTDFPLAPGQLPVADGALDLSLTGGAELLQRFVNGGIISTQQAMGAQVMMGMMMREGPDGTLETRIETGADGSLTVNGNRLR